jgi:hypothetical protein
MEAMTCRRRVLAFGSASDELRELICEELRIGTVHTDSVSLAGAITDLVRGGLQGPVEPAKEAAAPYHARGMVERTLGLLT